MTHTIATLALPAASIVERVGAYVGFLAFLGLAILALLYFSQARDVRRLREWAGRAPERAAELENRVEAPAQSPTVVRKAAPAPTTTSAPALGAGQAPAAQTAAGKAAAASQGPPGQVAAGAAAAATGSPGEVAETGQPGTNGDAGEVGDTGEHELDEAGGTGEHDQAADIAAIADQPTVAAPTVPDEIDPLEPGEGLEPLEPLPPEHYLPGSSYRTAADRPKKPLSQRARSVHIPQIRYVLAAVAIFAVLVIALGSLAGVIDIGGGGDSGSGSSGQQAGKQSTRGSKVAPVNIDPSQVTVAVLNGTTVTGLAFKVSQEVKSGGFVLGNVTNAATTDQQKSEVVYAPGQKNAARAVANELGITTVAPVDSVNSEIAGSADAVVLVGADRSG